MRIASGIDFLLGKNKFWMYDESPFLVRYISVLTTNAVSEKFVGKVSFHKTFQDSEKLRARVPRVEQTFQDSENQANR
jgi:hypothetical protein